MKKVVILILIVFAYGCSKEDERFVDPGLAPYLEIFQDEAMLRGVVVDYDELGLEVFLVSMSSDGVKGQCVHQADDAKTVNIDLNFWNENDHFSKEFLFFHELGHCVLGRNHLDDVNENNRCISIMNSGSSACRSSYQTGTRKEFLDELFSKN
jgi:hypothetical protein